MSNLKTVALITDFGLHDSYVAEMKGVMLSINRDLRFVDISHDVELGDIRRAAYLLWRSHAFFPTGTFFLAVVDPGVGSERRIIMYETTGHTFVAPDNGILSMVMSDTDGSCREIANQDYCIGKASETFEGRDVMAPACAYLSLGTDPESFGALIHDPVLLDVYEPEIEGGAIRGQILAFDRFGNVITNIDSDMIREEFSNLRLVAGDQFIKLGNLVRTFSDVSDGTVIAYRGSSGLVEIAISMGNMRQKYQLNSGEEIRIEFDDK